MKTKTDLRIPRAVASSVEDSDAPRSPIEHVALVAATELEKAQRQIAGLADKNKALREQVAHLQGAQSVYALTEGGMAVVRQGEILAKLDQILANQDRAAQVLTALSLDHVTRAEHDELKRYAEWVSSRTPV